MEKAGLFQTCARRPWNLNLNCTSALFCFLIPSLLVDFDPPASGWYISGFTSVSIWKELIPEEGRFSASFGVVPGPLNISNIR